MSSDIQSFTNPIYPKGSLGLNGMIRVIKSKELLCLLRIAEIELLPR